MAKILSIPDVHGSHNWEIVRSISPEEYDYIVFHGDYFDSWENEWPDQGDNFRSICGFVREDTEHRKLLIGNHDWSYLSQSQDGQNCSGHQSSRIGKEGKITTIRELLLGAKDILQLAFEYDGWVFSHAGFSETAVRYMKSVLHDIYDNDEYSIDLLNATFRKRLEEYDIPDNAKWIPFDEKLDWDGCFSGSGNEPSQFCLWIRPEALLDDLYYEKQVVGHSEICIYDKIFLRQKEKKVVFIDSPSHEVYGIFDTKKEYPFMTLQEYFKVRKKTMKIINDISSQLIYHKDMEGFIKKSLSEHFPEDAAVRILKTRFKGYLNTDYISAMDNLWEMQKAAHRSGADKMTLEEINAEIAAYRRGE